MGYDEGNSDHRTTEGNMFQSGWQERHDPRVVEMNGRWILPIVGGAWTVAAIVLVLWGSTMVAQADVDDVLEGMGFDDGGGTSSSNVVTGTFLIWFGFIMLILGVIILIIGLVMAFRDRAMGDAVRVRARP